MSEEIKAIETLKNIVIQEYDWWINKGDYAESNVKEANDAIKTILNLIEKQQKEIEELKEDNNHQWKERCKLFFKLENSISKDKIKEIIYLTPKNPISIDIQSSKIYKRLEELLEEE